MKLKPVMAVMCDSIREEINGKLSLVGVYSGGLDLLVKEESLENSEIVLNVSFWLPLVVEGTGKLPFELEIKGPGPKHKITIKGEFEIKDVPQPTEHLPLKFPDLPLKIAQEGEITVSFKSGAETTAQVLRIIPVTLKRISGN